MKITARFGRTIGQPGYSSVRADCEVEQTLSAAAAGDAGRVVAAIREMYDTARAAVEDQLAEELRRQHAAAAEAAAVPARVREPGQDDEQDLDPEPGVGDYSDRGRKYWKNPPYGSGRNRDDKQWGDPTNGRQLLAHCRRLGEQDGVDRLPLLGRWARAEGHTWKVSEWDEEQTAAALHYLERYEARAAKLNGRTNGKQPF